MVSDGNVLLKARLSPSVVDVLEAELDGPLEKNTGDVFRLLHFVVVTTCIGPKDDWIQLTIEEIEYSYNRRKNVGQPAPITLDIDIRNLVTDGVTALISSRPEIAEEEEEEEEETEVLRSQQKQREDVPVALQNNAEDAEDLQSQDIQREGASIAVHRSSPPTVAGSQQPQSRLGLMGRATAETSHKRPRLQGPTLQNDGFEVQSGVNLQRPVAAKRTGTLVLQLLNGKEKLQPEIIAETPARRAVGDGDIRGHGVFAREVSAEAESTASSGEAMEVDNSPQVSEARAYSPSLPSPSMIQPSQATHHQSESRRPSRSPSRSRVRVSPERCKYPRTSVRAASPVITKTPTQPKLRRLRIPYGRRKIPANQRLLLNQDSSWFPELPGRRFPKPNVPIELLAKWNAAPSPSQKSTVASKQNSESPKPAQRLSAAAPEQDEDSSKSHSTSSDESDAPVSESEWPLSQSQSKSRPKPRPNLPPDSSLGNLVRGTPEELEVEPPKALIASTQRAIEQPQRPLSHLLPKRPASSIPRELDTVMYPRQSQPINTSLRDDSRPQTSSQMPRGRYATPTRDYAHRTATSSARDQLTPTGARHTLPPRDERPPRYSQGPPAGGHARNHDMWQPPRNSHRSPQAPRDRNRQARREWHQAR